MPKHRQPSPVHVFYHAGQATFTVPPHVRPRLRKLVTWVATGTFVVGESEAAGFIRAFKNAGIGVKESRL